MNDPEDSENNGQESTGRRLARVERQIELYRQSLLLLAREMREVLERAGG